MLGIDRPSDCRRDVPDAGPDRAPDAPQPANAPGPGRGIVLTDARTRVQHALAYRAKVDAVYAGADPEAAKDNAKGNAKKTAAERADDDTDRPADRPSVVDKYPNDYVPATHDPPRVLRPHERPEQWLRDVNFDDALPGRRNNCGECSRAVYSTWLGVPKAAAAMADRYSGGEPTGRMTEWAGQRPVAASMAEIGKRLSELGPGTSAIVGCDWKDGNGGHWFNAVNDGGVLKTVDGQRNRVGSWPPAFSEVRFDESMMGFSDAIFFGPDGKVVANDHT